MTIGYPDVRVKGVDLGDPKQKGLIDRIYWARFSKRVAATGMDPEEGLQCVYMGILARNNGKRPWDPKISSLSNYGFIVIRSVCQNIAEKCAAYDRRSGTVGTAEDAGSWDRAGAGSIEEADWDAVAEAAGVSVGRLLRMAGMDQDGDALDLFS